MTKDQLIDALAAEANIARAIAEQALEAFTTATTTALVNGGPVDLEGFGEFTVVLEGNGEPEKSSKV